MFVFIVKYRVPCKKRLLNVLVMTGKSDTKKKAFWRYNETGQHIETWYRVSAGEFTKFLMAFRQTFSSQDQPETEV